MTNPIASEPFLTTVARWARALRPALLIVAGLAFAALWAMALQLRTELRTFQEEPMDNIHWTITQLEVDIVRLESQVQVQILDPGADMKELRLRYDLFYSRAQAVLQGKMFAQLGLTDIIGPLNQRLQGFLNSTTPLIDSDDASLRQNLPAMLPDVAALRDDLRSKSVDLIDKYAALADTRRAAFADLLQQVAWASAVLLAVLVLLLVLVLWLNRQAARNIRVTRRVSARLAATVDTSLDAIIVAGRDGHIIDFNSAAERTFGFSRAEAIGVSLADLIVPPQHRDAHIAGLTRMNRTGEMRLSNSGRFRITALHKDGREFPIEMSLASTEEAGDTLFISYLRDISHRVAAEEAVISARDKALAAEQAKINFMAVMSHEMRTPLNGVMAALEIASRETVDAKQARFLELARSSARQLLRHANEVLDISKIDAGRLELTDENFDLAELIDTLVGTLMHVAAQNNTTISVSALSEIPLLHGDPFRLGQIVQNFLSNAIKFTTGGKITIEYEIQSETANQVVIELRVSDTGIGIAEADQERVFEDFVMIDPSYGRSSGGTGLGLAISQRLATAMGGEIGVESDLGQGSCFWVSVPFRRAVLTPSEPTDAKPGLAGTSKDILVVEDNATNRIVLDEMLRHLGHRVTLATDGGDGMSKARDHAFDVILMDISMPIMDGVTATEMIRWEGASKFSRIFAITAHSMPEDRDRFTAAGMDGYLTKPISEADLSRALSDDPELIAPVVADKGIVDLDRIADLRLAMGEAGVRRVLDQFLRDLPGVRERLDVAAADQQLAALMQAAHDGAGACAMVGAATLGHRLAAIEQACRQTELAAACQILADTAPLWQPTTAILAARKAGS